MTLQLHETIHNSNKLLKRYGKLIDFDEFQKQILLCYNQPHTVKYLSTVIPHPIVAIIDSFYYPVQSKRLGKTVAYLRGGRVRISDSETVVVWWADLLGAFSGEIHFKA